MSILLALVPLLMAASPAVREQCTPIRGWDQAVSDTKVRWIIIGEVHGSNEVPDIFADAVCLTSQSGPVIVAVEQASLDQALIDRFLASDGGLKAQRAFLKAQMWNEPLKDGRSSQAYFRLFEALREMRSAGRISSVIAFQPTNISWPFTPETYEKAMASILLQAAGPSSRVIALVGNVHAMRTEVKFSSAYVPMADHLPRQETRTFNTVSDGGEHWTCSSPENGPVICGPRPYPKTGQPHQRGIELSATNDGPYSGAIYLGTPATASSPQIVPRR